MSLFGGIVGGFVGFTLLGPIGALVGSVVGSRMTENKYWSFHDWILNVVRKLCSLNPAQKPNIPNIGTAKYKV